MNLFKQGRGTLALATLVLAGAATTMALLMPSGLESVRAIIKSNFNLFTAIKWSAIATAVGGLIYIISSNKLVHLKVIEIGEMGFRTHYGDPVFYRNWPRPIAWLIGRSGMCGMPIVYYPGDKVLYIPIVRGVTIVNTRPRVMTIERCEGVFMGRNILFALSIKWQVLADVESAFLAAFGLYDPDQTDQSQATLNTSVANAVLNLVDRSLATMEGDQEDLPRFETLDLYSEALPIDLDDTRPILLPLIEEHGSVVNKVTAMNRRPDPEERNRQGQEAIARAIAARVA